MQKVLMKHVKVLLLHWSMVLLVCLKSMGGEYEILGTPITVLVESNENTSNDHFFEHLSSY